MKTTNHDAFKKKLLILNRVQLINVFLIFVSSNIYIKVFKYNIKIDRFFSKTQLHVQNIEVR